MLGCVFTIIKDSVVSIIMFLVLFQIAVVLDMFGKDAKGIEHKVHYLMFTKIPIQFGDLPQASNALAILYLIWAIYIAFLLVLAFHYFSRFANGVITLAAMNKPKEIVSREKYAELADKSAEAERDYHISVVAVVIVVLISFIVIYVIPNINKP